MLLNCPKPEVLLELFTIPDEISLRQKLSTRAHAFFCAGCQDKLAQLQRSWSDFFKPEPDITPSLLKVYSRLQSDETLILKGWKLGEAPRRRGARHFLFKEGWLFRGSVSLAMASMVVFVVTTSLSPRQNATEDLMVERRSATGEVPLVQIRIQKKDQVKVHYLQPELLQTIEFETTRAE